MADDGSGNRHRCSIPQMVDTSANDSLRTPRPMAASAPPTRTSEDRGDSVWVSDPSDVMAAFWSVIVNTIGASDTPHGGPWRGAQSAGPLVPQRVVEGSYAGWLGAPLMLKPALSSMNGSERRKRQLDSLRTLSPILVALPVACDTASLADGRVPMSSRSEVHRCSWWSRHKRQPAELQALRGPYAGVRAARRVLREHQGLRCAEAAWENGGGTGEHGGRRELADGRRTAARHVDKAVEKPGMGRSRGSRKVHSPPWWAGSRRKIAPRPCAGVGS